MLLMTSSMWPWTFHNALKIWEPSKYLQRVRYHNCHRCHGTCETLIFICSRPAEGGPRPTSYVYIKCLYVAEDSSQNPYQICDKSYYGMYKEVTQDLSKVPYHNFSKTECSGKYLEVAED